VKSTFKISRTLFITSSLLLIISFGLYLRTINFQKQTVVFQKVLTQRISEFERFKKEVLTDITLQNPMFFFENDSLLKHMKKKHFGLFIYKGNKPIFWSDAVTKPKSDENSRTLVELNNGWFIRDIENTKGYTIYWLLELSEQFSIKNHFLKPRFLIDQQLPPGVKISKTEKPGTFPVIIKGLSLFSLDFTNSKPGSTSANTVFTILFFVWFSTLLTFIFQRWLIVKPKHKNRVTALIIIVVSIIIRLVWLNNPFPSSLYQNPLFDPGIYAQSAVFSSLGDLVINALIILFFSFIIADLLKQFKLKLTSYNAQLIWFFFLVMNLIFIYGINTLLVGLVKNSRIPFNLGHLFEIESYSLIAMLSMGLIFFSYYNLILAFIRKIKQTDLSFHIVVLLSFTVYGLYAAVMAGFSSFEIIDVFWSLPIIIAIASWVYFPKHIFYVGVSLFNLAAFSFFSAYVFEKINVEKEHNIRRVIGERINQVQDPLLDLSFDDAMDKLIKSPGLKQAFTKNRVKPEMLNRLSSYFGNEWYRFDKQVSLSGPNLNPLPGSPEISALEIDSLIKTDSKYLFFFFGDRSGLGYLFSVPFIENHDTIGYVNGIFTEVPEPTRKGFPELLNNENRAFNKYSDEYIYARYRGNSRVFTNSEADFPPDLSRSNLHENSEGYLENDRISILILPEKFGSRWMIGKYKSRFIQHVTTFSYLFLFLGILYLLWLITTRFFTRNEPLKLPLRTKIQIILIGFVFGILTLYALVVYGQITSQFHQRNTEQITERLNSIGIELQHKTGHLNTLKNMPKEELKGYLDKFSEVFYSDISVFDDAGLLNGSSSSQIWKKNLLSRRINPKAYKAIEMEKGLRFIHEESIGSFNYLSGYKPIFNDVGKKLGVLNVPYFARQDELKKEINRFLLILLNVFVLLTGISVIVAIYVSNWITAPLKLLQTSFSSLDLINKNRPISYSGDDEVATMVKVYNQKVEELEKMADQIAESERESAWREMARQVAHEIKNPLTPMRLSIQHFQRILVQDPEKAAKRSNDLMNSLIEQIDNLTQIANEFSQFAKISVSSKSIFDLKSLMNDLVSLYLSNEKVELILNTELEEAPIEADKGQIIRMFNNLIQNAIQAIGQKNDGKIKMSLKKEELFYQIEIDDNGKGIPENIKLMIFKPNFTTKSTGMGLGLAIVNKIVSNHGGTIRYETEKEKGTVFTVLLPFN